MVAVRIGTQRPNKFGPTDCVGPNCSANPLPAGYVAHVGQAVGDALVAIDAGRIAASQRGGVEACRPRTLAGEVHGVVVVAVTAFQRVVGFQSRPLMFGQDRKSTRLNSSHVKISYAVFCLKKKKI